MGAPQSGHADNDDNQWSEGPLLPRWALWVMLPGIIAPLLIFGFIVFTETAHDEQGCPYAEVERRELAAGTVVIEERRSCLESIEERRFTLLRGQQARVLGRRRFEQADFEPARYGWSAEISAQDEVVVTIRNEGHADLLLREGTPEELEKGISY